MVPTVTLGDTGIEVSELNFGTGTHGWSGNSDQTRLGEGALIDLLVYGYDQGITFWDSADQYGSHPHVKGALKRVGRDNVVVTTKTCAASREDTEKDLERYLAEIGTDHLDIVMMHCMNGPDWPKEREGAMEALSKAKEKGLIRAHGISSHNFGALQSAAGNPWVDVVLARINYDGCHCDAEVPEVIKVLEEMHAEGTGIYGMKTLGCGDLAGEVPKAAAFVRGLPCVHAVTIGMKSRTEVDENVRLFGPTR